MVCRHADADVPTDAAVLTAPCLARLKVVHVLKLFQDGYQSVSLYACSKEECKYGTAWRNIQTVASQVRRLLKDANLDGEIELCLPQQETPLKTG